MWQEKLNKILTLYNQYKYNRIYSPFKLKLYSELLSVIDKDPSISWAPFFIDNKDTTGHKWVYVRHDIDTKDCLEMIPSFIDIDMSFKLIPGVFFIVDDSTYHFAKYKYLVRGLKEKNCVVGLHSTCYLKDDYMNEFQKEIDKFESIIGFKPDTFNVHGFGSYRLDTRLSFYNEIVYIYKDYGFKYSDCWSMMREYKYTIEDCHWCDKNNSRYIKDDFMRPQEYLKPGNNLLMTHPCYWNR